MRPRPDRTALAAALLLLALLLPAPAAAQDDLLPFSPESRRRRALIAAAGAEFPISGSQGVQPQLAGYLDLPFSLQAGLKARFTLEGAASDYDYIPQVALHLRRLWLSDQDSSTVGNSEYGAVIVGGYPAYDFVGERSGARPFLSLAIGKYWMPFENAPYGLDFSLEITRFIDGHPPGNSRVSFLTCGLNLFRPFSL